MNIFSKAAMAGVASLFIASSAMSADVVGVVSDNSGTPVNGATVTVTDASGKQVANAKSNGYGRYCIGGLQPGKYTVAMTPPAGYEGGTGVADVDIEGLTVDWAASNANPALAKSKLGVASPATATCAGAWWPTAAAATVGVAGVGGIIGGVLGGGDNDGGNSSPSK